MGVDPGRDLDDFQTQTELAATTDPGLRQGGSAIR